MFLRILISVVVLAAMPTTGKARRLASRMGEGAYFVATQRPAPGAAAVSDQLATEELTRGDPDPSGHIERRLQQPEPARHEPRRWPGLPPGGRLKLERSASGEAV